MLGERFPFYIKWKGQVCKTREYSSRDLSKNERDQAMLICGMCEFSHTGNSKGKALKWSPFIFSKNNEEVHTPETE